MSPVEPPVFIGLGANLPSAEGDPGATLSAALRDLEVLSERPLRCSAFWESDPVDCPPGSPRYVNAVAMLQPGSGATPQGLLEQLQAIEARYGRQRSGVVNEARVLDLDLLAWGYVILQSETLTLPHPRAHQRAFVLAPWAELMPDFVLPGVGQSVAALLREVDRSGIRRKT